MSESLPKIELVPSKTQKGTIIEILKDAYAKDLISIDEYEKRVEFAEKSKSIEEINLLVQDIPSDLFAESSISESESIRCEMSSKQFNGSFLRSKKITIEASMSTIILDYRTVKPIKGIQEIILNTKMTNIILFLPNNITTENRINEQMTEFKETKSNINVDIEKISCIRFLGDAEMTTIKIKRERQRIWIFGNKARYK